MNSAIYFTTAVVDAGAGRRAGGEPGSVGELGITPVGSRGDRGRRAGGGPGSVGWASRWWGARATAAIGGKKGDRWCSLPDPSGSEEVPSGSAGDGRAAGEGSAAGSECLGEATPAGSECSGEATPLGKVHTAGGERTAPPVLSAREERKQRKKNK